MLPSTVVRTVTVCVCLYAQPRSRDSLWFRIPLSRRVTGEWNKGICFPRLLLFMWAARDFALLILQLFSELCLNPSTRIDFSATKTEFCTPSVRNVEAMNKKHLSALQRKLVSALQTRLMHENLTSVSPVDAYLLMAKIQDLSSVS